MAMQVKDHEKLILRGQQYTDQQKDISVELLIVAIGQPDLSDCVEYKCTCLAVGLGN